MLNNGLNVIPQVKNVLEIEYEKDGFTQINPRKIISCICSLLFALSFYSHKKLVILSIVQE